MTVAPRVAVRRPERPYPGLRPFEPDEWAIFFGREQMVHEVIDRLAQNRLVLIHGVSGSGKSSLVRAGVLPKLALQYRRHDAPWLTCGMRPSGGPLWNLAAEFARLEGRARDAERIGAIAGQFNARSATLASVAASLKAVHGKSLCVLVDQFEELFRYEKNVSRDEAELFANLILRAAQEDGNESAPDAVDLHVIVTMRSEFVGECSRFPGFAETFNRVQYLMPRMDDDAVMRAVRAPAQMYGVDIDEALAVRLIASVRGHEDELPLLQHGLMLMWVDAVQNERAMLDGAIVDEVGGLAQLLSSHADKVMAAAAPNERGKRIVEAVFRALSDVNVYGSMIRCPRPFHELCAVAGAAPDELRLILNAFRARDVSFLAPYGTATIDDKTLIDISHEALIRYWGRVSRAETGWLKSGTSRKAASNPRKSARRYYVSYAWSDSSDPDREEAVDWLCDEAKKRGTIIIRDKTSISAGALISDFMKKVGEGDRVFIFLSDKYLQSEYCMNELCEIWQNSCQSKKKLLSRVRFFTINDATLGGPEDWLEYTRYWLARRDSLKMKIDGVGLEYVGDEVFKRYKLIVRFAGEVSNILAHFADAFRPRSFEEFLSYGFNDLPSRTSIA